MDSIVKASSNHGILPIITVTFYRRVTTQSLPGVPEWGQFVAFLVASAEPLSFSLRPGRQRRNAAMLVLTLRRSSTFRACDKSRDV